MSCAYVKDPNATLPFVWDWSAWLANEGNDTITSAVVTVPTAELTLGSITNTTTKVTAWISGGTDGEDVDVTCHIVTAGGRQEDRSITVKVRER